MCTRGDATPSGMRCEWGVTRNVEQAIACRSEVYVTEERVLNGRSLEHIGDFVVFAYRLCEEELTSIGTLETQERVCLASLGVAQKGQVRHQRPRNVGYLRMCHSQEDYNTDKDGSLWSRQAVLGLIYDSLTQLAECVRRGKSNE